MSKRYWIAASVLGALCVSAVLGWAHLKARSHALESMEAQCLAHQLNGVAPCVRVDRGEGYVILRDRKGAQHFLLLPVERISGIEGEQLLDPGTPNFFWYTWQNRGLLAGQNGRPIPDTNTMLAINSKLGRSQGQMHIHISCTKADVVHHLSRLDGTITDTWQPLQGGLEEHSYLARRVSIDQFEKIGPFRLLAFGFPRAFADMGRFSLAVTMSRRGDILLLATERDMLDLNLASAEELQDQDCAGYNEP